MTEAATEDETRTERSVALRKAYGLANTRLRGEYRDRFDVLYAEEAGKLGVDYSPRLTPEQKAEQEMDDLLAKFPHLADKLS